MKKRILSLLLLTAIFAALFLFVACEETVPVRVEITVYPEVLTVPRGGAPDLTDAWVTVSYSDGTKKEVAMSSLKQRGLNTSALGVQTLVLVYSEGGKSFSVTLDMTVVVPKVESLELQTEGVKTNYLEGEAFSADSLVVIAHYVTGSSEEISLYDISPAKLSLETTAVRISYRGVSEEIPVTVVKKAPRSLTILSAPTKTSYYEGEDFDPSGLTCKVTYNDGKEETFFAAQAEYLREDEGDYNYPFDLSDNKVRVVVTTEFGKAESELTLEVKKVVPLSMSFDLKDTLVFEEGDLFALPDEEFYVTIHHNFGPDTVVASSAEGLLIFDDTPLTTDQTEIAVGLAGYLDVEPVMISIQVNEATVSYIFFDHMPDKRTYHVGETVENLDGLVLRVIMSNRREYTRPYSATGGITFSPSVVEETTGQLTVTYGGKTLSLPIDVLPAASPSGD